MSYDDAIRLLNQHLIKLRSFNNDFEAWLDTAVELITETFGIISQQHNNFTSLRSDFRIARISDKTPQLILRFSQRANQQINSMIELLQERKRQAIQASEIEKQKQEALKSEREKFQKEQQPKLSQQSINPITSIKATMPSNKISKKVEPKDKKHYTIGIGLFWTVALSLAGGIFWFGSYVGTSKYDIDKSALSEKNIQLVGEISNLKTEVSTLKYALRECEKKTLRGMIDINKDP